MEAVYELLYVLVDEGVVGDLTRPFLGLRLVSKLTVQQQVGDLEERGLLGELLDGVTR